MHLSGLPWRRECCHRLPPKHLSLLEPLGKEEHLELCNQFVVQSWYGHGWNSCFRLLGSFCQGLPGLRVMSMPALGSRSTCSHIPVSQWACIYTLNTHTTNTIYWIVQSVYGLHYAVQLPNKFYNQVSSFSFEAQITPILMHTDCATPHIISSNYVALHYPMMVTWHSQYLQFTSLPSSSVVGTLVQMESWMGWICMDTIDSTASSRWLNSSKQRQALHLTRPMKMWPMDLMSRP